MRRRRHKTVRYIKTQHQIKQFILYGIRHVFLLWVNKVGNNNCGFTKYHTTNKCTNCMSFILNHFFKTLFTAHTCFDSISLIIIREHI